MNFRTVFVSLIYLLFTGVAVNSFGARAQSFDITVAESTFVSSEFSNSEDGIVPATVSIAEYVPVPFRTPYPVNRVSSFRHFDGNSAMHNRLAYYGFHQPVLYHESPPLYISVCLLLI